MPNPEKVKDTGKTHIHDKGNVSPESFQLHKKLIQDRNNIEHTQLKEVSIAQEELQEKGIVNDQKRINALIRSASQEALNPQEICQKVNSRLERGIRQIAEYKDTIQQVHDQLEKSFLDYQEFGEGFATQYKDLKQTPSFITDTAASYNTEFNKKDIQYYWIYHKAEDETLELRREFEYGEESRQTKVDIATVERLRRNNSPTTGKQTLEITLQEAEEKVKEMNKTKEEFESLLKKSELLLDSFNKKSKEIRQFRIGAPSHHQEYLNEPKLSENENTKEHKNVENREITIANEKDAKKLFNKTRSILIDIKYEADTRRVNSAMKLDSRKHAEGISKAINVLNQEYGFTKASTWLYDKIPIPENTVKAAQSLINLLETSKLSVFKAKYKLIQEKWPG